MSVLSWAESVEETQDWSSVPFPGEWVAKGRCRKAPQEIFFPVRGEPTERARALCRQCPVAQECLDYALAHARLQGVWGGTSGKERREILNGSKRRPTFDKKQAAAAPKRLNKAKLYRTLEQLLDHPAQWAKVAHFNQKGQAAVTASMCRNGQRAVPAGRWSFEARVNPEGGSDLYARLESVEGAA